ncbi:MAG: UDP-glucose/GDP-mannose dehydrogenase family protein [bacterium]|nr:UDP-glucose/GDP-mannose dehydrogenase family protein [bacterium]
MRIAVIGTGYVGLVAGVCFADTANNVTCVDLDPDKVARMQAGEVPIYEPGLEPILARALREGRISFTTNHADAMVDCDVCFIAVGTPEGPDGAPMLNQVDSAVETCVKAATGPFVLVLKSTVPVGTAERTRKIIAEHASHPVSVVNNPEFLKEGAAVDDFRRPDRVVIGTDSDEAWSVMQRLYDPIVLGNRPILRMSNVAAEITKYAANAMLATRISFMNEIAGLCDAVGADVRDVQQGIGTDGRIGKPFLHAGCGYGGSCFPKDTQGLIHVARAAGVEMQIVTSVEQVNDAQKLVLLEKIDQHMGKDLSGKRIALWGLAFKPHTDDVREAPAQVIARGLVDRGAAVIAHDPEARETFRAAFGDDISYVDDAFEALKGADALVLCTEWNEYRGASLQEIADAMSGSIIFDGRNVFDGDRARERGFTHVGIGLGK